MTDYKAAWMARTRIWAKELLGGHCVRCDTTEDLEFDHIIPGSRTFLISIGIAKGYSRARLEAELQKCQLLCKSCHRKKSVECDEISHGGRIDEHGTEAYRQRMKCECELCLQARHDARVRRGETTGTRGRRKLAALAQG